MVVKWLDWANASEVEVVRGMIQEAIVRTNSPNLLIIASDVLYNHESHQNLACTLHQLSSSNVPTRIMIGYLNDRDNDEASFTSRIPKLEVILITNECAIQIKLYMFLLFLLLGL